MYQLCHFLFFMFQREEQWHDEQKKILNALKETEKKMEEDIESHCQRRYCYNIEVFCLEEFKFQEKQVSKQT